MKLVRNPIVPTERRRLRRLAQRLDDHQVMALRSLTSGADTGSLGFVYGHVRLNELTRKGVLTSKPNKSLSSVVPMASIYKLTPRGAYLVRFMRDDKPVRVRQ